MMKVEVMDKDTFDDDIIGYGVYNIAQYMAQRMSTTGTPLHAVAIDMVYKNRHAGRVTIGIDFQGAMMGMGYM